MLKHFPAALPFFFCLALICSSASAQELKFEGTIAWKKPEEIRISQYDIRKAVYFTGAQYLETAAGLPWFLDVRPLGFNGKVSAITLERSAYVAATTEEIAIIGASEIGSAPLINAETIFERGKPFISLQILPFRKLNGQIEKLASYELKILFSGSVNNSVSRSTTTSSVLSSGNWYKVGITSSGVFKLSKSFLASLGLNTSGNPRNIRLFGNGGAQLPERNNAYYPDDLVENAVYFQGESDGSFNDEDFILFYGQGPVTWSYDATKAVFRHTRNTYADTAWYYIIADNTNGKRITSQPQSPQSATATVTQFDDYSFIENDEENPLKSGRRWFGNRMEIVNSHSFTFDFPNIANGPHKVVSNVAARHSAATTFSLNVAGQVFTQTTGSVNVSDYNGIYAKESENVFNFVSSAPNLPASITKLSSGGIGWLDYMIVNVTRNMTFSGSQLAFRNQSLTGSGNVLNYQLGSAFSGLKVWEVTNIFDVHEQQNTISGSTLSFTANADSLRQFVAINPSGDFPSPAAGGAVANQNLHGTGQTTLIIVAPSQLTGPANTLAQHHRDFDGMTVQVVSPKQIYNEFSSGKQDIAAIRNYVRMLYERFPAAAAPKYLLLMGDGTYNPKTINGGSLPFIPTYESVESLNPLYSYATDDFYTLMDPAEGTSIHSSGAGSLDIGVGRFPASSVEEATAIVNKIINYVTNPACMNDWRNIVTFIADDEDSATHLDQAEAVSNVLALEHPRYNIEKIYLDAYQQEAGAGGQRFPQANIDITNRVNRGTLFMNYAGHGGEQSLALERVITIPEINDWEGYNNMPLFMTATCEFSRFDNPDFTSAGEYVILNPTGGGIALFTTVRLTFASSNQTLNLSIMDTIFSKVNGQYQRLGDIMRAGKNRAGSSPNNRSFALMGDPALSLAFPEYDVTTTEINSKTQAQFPDTLSALEYVTVKGFISDDAGNLVSDFNGVVTPTVFDKATVHKTLQNDPSSPLRNFKVQKSIIFRGPVTVTNGAFTFSFVVPQDIQLPYGYGKISYYARKNNSLIDAAGALTNVIVGGFSNNPVTDSEGPKIRLFMNNEQFVMGGMTDENPELLAFVEDDIGINTVGTGIGHDITAIIDGNSSNPVILNDFYEAQQDDFRKGSVRYPYKDLAPGVHTITFKAWDVANNSATASIEFVVIKAEEVSLNHVLNYPNPFTTNTQFFFEYNQPGVPVNVDIQIFTVSGKLVKTLESNMVTNGFRSDPIVWNGLDDFGDRIGRGVYVYRLRVRTPEGKSAEKFEKLVILN